MSQVDVYDTSYRYISSRSTKRNKGGVALSRDEDGNAIFFLNMGDDSINFSGVVDVSTRAEPVMKQLNIIRENTEQRAAAAINIKADGEIWMLLSELESAISHYVVTPADSSMVPLAALNMFSSAQAFIQRL